MFRRIIELLVRERHIKRRLPERYHGASLYVTGDAQLKYLKPTEEAFDTELLAVIDEHIKEDSIVWDVGANVGVFTVCSAAMASKGYVLAIEADIWLAHLIQKSLALPENVKLKAEVLPCAVSDKAGVSKFLVANRGRASNCLESVNGRSQAGGYREKVLVPTCTLDSLMPHFPHPTFIKIDVEGAEVLVLSGALEILKTVRPTIYIEVGEEAAATVSSLLTQADYLVFDGAKPLKSQTPLNSCPFNALAIPREKHNP